MVRGVFIMLVLTALALLLVWQGAELRATGYEVERLQQRIADQNALTAIYQAHLSKLKNPARVTTLVGWLKLDLQQQVPEAAADDTALAAGAPAGAAPTGATPKPAGATKPGDEPKPAGELKPGGELKPADRGPAAVAAAPGF